MKLRNIIAPLLALLNDARAAELLLEEQDSEFARRAYVRSSFAYYEGAVWLLKQACLHGHGSRRYSLAEYALLRDESYELKSNGEPYAQTKFLRLPDNLRFSVKVFNRLFGAEVDLGVGTVFWDRFREA